jgi:hypothetical protein
MQDLLHVFAQPFWHQPLYIVGDKTGLLSLKKAIDQALVEEQGHSEVYTNDGEGYDCYVKCLVDEAQQEQLMLPYADPPCDLPKDGLKPHDLIDHGSTRAGILSK